MDKVRDVRIGCVMPSILYSTLKRVVNAPSLKRPIEKLQREAKYVGAGKATVDAAAAAAVGHGVALLKKDVN